MVASDGGIFAFGDAPFEGSLGASPPTSSIAYMAATPDNDGYWLVSQDGTVYAFGDASNYGSVQGASAPATSLAATPSGGYWVLTADGAVHPFGDASNFGSPATGPVAPLSLPNGPPSQPSGSDGSGIAGGSVSGGSNSVSISALTPSSGTAGGGDTIEISGSGFTGATAVDFGRNASSDFTVTSATTITAVAPVGTGTVSVEVVTPAGTSGPSSAAQFTYIPTGQPPITAHGQSLEIGGVPTLFTGFNAYQLATDWGTNAGCGGMATTAQIDAFFSSLRPNSLVRFWAFQETMATNIHTDQLDWAPLDNVFYQAAKYHVYLIPTISDQAGTCDGGHWQDSAWYSGGFRNVYNSADNSDGSGRTPLSFWDYMNALVSRYADSPALGMWEPMSEAEASNCQAPYQGDSCYGHQTCPNEAAAAAALEYFFTTVGSQIRSLDPEHLVEGGLLGGGQCGTSGTDYQSVGASPGIDVLSVHDYWQVPLGGDQWNGMAVRFAQAKALDKPIITGEAGITAGRGQSGCVSLQQRALDMSAKIAAQVRSRRQRLSGMELGARSSWTVQRQHRSERQLAPRRAGIGAYWLTLDDLVPKLLQRVSGRNPVKEAKSRYRPAAQSGTRMTHLPVLPNQRSNRRYESPRSSRRQTSIPTAGSNDQSQLAVAELAMWYEMCCAGGALRAVVGSLSSPTTMSRCAAENSGVQVVRVIRLSPK